MNLFDLKELIDETIYGIFNVVSRLVFFLRFGLRRLLASNQRFKGRHVGETCYIFGTGPSVLKISNDQLEKINQSTVFAVNSLFRSEVIGALDVDYYCMMDNVYWTDSSDDLICLSRSLRRPPVLITDYRAKSILEEKGVTQCFSDIAYVFAKDYPQRGVRFDMSGNISAVNNVVSYAILVAMYMGFKNIKLVGCDYNLFCCRSESHYCYSNGSESRKNLEYYLRFFAITTRFHYEIFHQASKENVRIVNATPGSLLDAYPAGEI